jgi:AcrR family transcriptional regulator
MDPRVQRSRLRAIAAAQVLMLDGGLDAITPSRVAQVSGLGRKTIYRLWPTRTELLHDVLATSSSAEYELGGDPATDIRTHLIALSIALTHGPLETILGALAERARLDPELAALRSRLAEEGRAPLVKILADAVELGAIRIPSDVDTAATLMEGAVIYEATVRGREPDVAFIDTVIAAVLDRR